MATEGTTLLHIKDILGRNTMQAQYVREPLLMPVHGQVL